MTDRKPELPKLDEETLELMRACGYDELDRTHIALEGREAQLLSALTKIAAMEELLHEMRDVLRDVEWSGEDISCPQCATDITCVHKKNCTLSKAIKRVDALLEGK